MPHSSADVGIYLGGEVCAFSLMVGHTSTLRKFHEPYTSHAGLLWKQPGMSGLEDCKSRSAHLRDKDAIAEKNPARHSPGSQQSLGSNELDNAQWNESDNAQSKWFLSCVRWHREPFARQSDAEKTRYPLQERRGAFLSFALPPLLFGLRIAYITHAQFAMKSPFTSSWGKDGVSALRYPYSPGPYRMAQDIAQLARRLAAYLRESPQGGWVVLFGPECWVMWVSRRAFNRAATHAWIRIAPRRICSSSRRRWSSQYPHARFVDLSQKPWAPNPGRNPGNGRRAKCGITARTPIGSTPLSSVKSVRPPLKFPHRLGDAGIHLTSPCRCR